MTEDTGDLDLLDSFGRSVKDFCTDCGDYVEPSDLSFEATFLLLVHDYDNHTRKAEFQS